MALSLILISKWRWGPVECPVLPTSATCWPWLTSCPDETSSLEAWAYRVWTLFP